MFRPEVKPLLSSEESENEWINSSEESSKYSGSESSDPEWANDIGPSGELEYFLIKHDESIIGQESPGLGKRNDFKRCSTKKVKGKLFKSRNKKGQKERPKKVNEDTTILDHIVIDVQINHLFTSFNKCKLEQLFGLSVENKEKSILVKNIHPEASYLYKTDITSYILTKINNTYVDTVNLNFVLDQIRVDNRLYQLTFCKDTNKSKTYSITELYQSKGTDDLLQCMKECNIAVIYLIGDTVSYCFPRPCQQNILYNIHGALATLNHLIPKILTGKSPKTTTIMIENSINNVFYHQHKSDLFLFTLPQERINVFGGTSVMNTIVRMLEFQYGDLRNCFSCENFEDRMDSLFTSYFTLLLSGGLQGKQSSVNVAYITRNNTNVSMFEDTLPCAHSISLPNEVKLQIDDSLFELEAADYREWLDDALNEQRLYVVIGCSLFYSGHLLSSHMTDEDLKDVQAFLTVKGLLAMSRNSCIDKLVVWKEVFISASRRKEQTAVGDYGVPEGRWFLLVVGKGKFLLATLMEAGGCTEEPAEHPSPAPFYVEECECCLELLFEVEVDKFLSGWFTTNASPSLQLDPETLMSKPSSSRDDIDKFDINQRMRIVKDSPEKRKHHSSEQINKDVSKQSPIKASTSNYNLKDQWYSGRRAVSVGNNLNSNPADDNLSQSSNRSEHRKGGRARNRAASSSSESDWDAQEDSRASDSLELSDVKRTILDEVNEIVVKRLTTGDRNVLFHFVQLDCYRGVFLAPVKDMELDTTNLLYSYILKMFRLCCEKIHTIFQEGLRFKEIVESSSGVNKPFVAVKEHGILLTVPEDILQMVSTTKRSHNEPYQFWVVGYLHPVPEPKELYVCYHESVPQDILELACRLSHLQ